MTGGPVFDYPGSIQATKRFRKLGWLALSFILVPLALGVWAVAVVQSLGPSAEDLRVPVGPLRFAVVAAEDGNFYRHGGVDFAAIQRALEVNLRNHRILQGGSTITQQLAKNLFLSEGRTFSRKIFELALALALERRFTKSEILGLYLHHVHYGMGQLGVENAARFYFNKPSESLTLSEASTLASLLPTNPDRLSDEVALLKSRSVVLDRIAFWFPGQFTEAELNTARSAVNVIKGKVSP